MSCLRQSSASLLGSSTLLLHHTRQILYLSDRVLLCKTVASKSQQYSRLSASSAKISVCVTTPGLCVHSSIYLFRQGPLAGSLGCLQFTILLAASQILGLQNCTAMLGLILTFHLIQNTEVVLTMCNLTTHVHLCNF